MRWTEVQPWTTAAEIETYNGLLIIALIYKLQLLLIYTWPVRINPWPDFDGLLRRGVLYPCENLGRKVRLSQNLKTDKLYPIRLVYLNEKPRLCYRFFDVIDGTM